MPFRKRSRSGEYRPFWYIELDLPSFGPTGCLSSRTKDKRKADRYEDMLRWLDDNEHWAILEGLRPRGRGQSGSVTLPRVYRARREDRILELRHELTDPLLTRAVEDAQRSISYNNHLVGLRHVLGLAPENARLSWATKPANINRMVGDLGAKGLAANTIRNEVWGGLSKLLQFHYGKTRAKEILSEADRPNADDRRDTHLEPGDIYAVMEHLEWEMRMYLVLLLSLGIDKKPTLALRVHHVNLSQWSVYIPDTKTGARKRTLDCPAAAIYALKLLCEGKSRKDRLISLSRGQVNYRWRLARTAADIEGVREKDLRHTFAVHYLQGGGNIAGLQNRMGHKRGGQSLDYARHETKGLSDMESAAGAMGLVLPDRLRSQLPARIAGEVETYEIPAWWYDRGASSGPIRYQARGTAGWKEKGHAEYMRERRRLEREKLLEAEKRAGAGGS